MVRLKRNLVKQEGENWGNEAHAKADDICLASSTKLFCIYMYRIHVSHRLVR